jgi:hypothetical protein
MRGPEPALLGPQYGSAFEDRSVVASNHARRPYPDEVFAILGGLLAGRPGPVLDLGCGTGIIAPHLVGLDGLDGLDGLASVRGLSREEPGEVFSWLPTQGCWV